VIKDFEEFVKSGDVIEGSPDAELAKSLLKVAKLRWQTIPNTPTVLNSFTIVENAYEAVRELIDGLMAVEGYKSYSQEASIAFAARSYLDDLSVSIVHRIDRYRQIRNDIKYRGILTTAEEARFAQQELGKAFEILSKLLSQKV